MICKNCGEKPRKCNCEESMRVDNIKEEINICKNCGHKTKNHKLVEPLITNFKRYCCQDRHCSCQIFAGSVLAKKMGLENGK